MPASDIRPRSVAWKSSGNGNARTIECRAMDWSTSEPNRRQIMAQPIAFLPPANHTASSAERLRNAPAEHAEALLSAYELLQLLHDRGVLNLLRRLVASGDHVIATITSAAA